MAIQLDRLIKCPRNTLDKIEIIVSDNCSTDDTESIVKSYINRGLELTYNKNFQNIGMDGNFVTCFKKAAGKYVWLLGDDDSIIIDSLVDIVNKLSGDQEYGLVHVYSKQENISRERYLEYEDNDEYAKTISYYITLISANIVCTKYVSQIDFDKYMGTWFTLMPLYLTALIEEKKNLLINFQVFEKPKDGKRNGGYNFFEVFVKNYLNIWKEFHKQSCFSRKTYKYIKKDSFKDLIAIHVFIFLLRGLKKHNYNIDNAWNYLFAYYGLEWYFYTTMIKIIFKRGLDKLRRICQR